jgi:hypothetical protein
MGDLGLINEIYNKIQIYKNSKKELNGNKTVDDISEKEINRDLLNNFKKSTVVYCINFLEKIDNTNVEWNIGNKENNNVAGTTTQNKSSLLIELKNCIITPGEKKVNSSVEEREREMELQIPLENGNNTTINNNNVRLNQSNADSNININKNKNGNYCTGINVKEPNKISLNNPTVNHFPPHPKISETIFNDEFFKHKHKNDSNENKSKKLNTDTLTKLEDKLIYEKRSVSNGRLHDLKKEFINLFDVGGGKFDEYASNKNYDK